MSTTRKSDMDLSAFSVEQGKRVLPAEGGKKPPAKGQGGRPTFKKSGIKYTKLVFEVPEDTKRVLKQALAGKFYGVYATQAELVDAAIKAFVSNK